VGTTRNVVHDGVQNGQSGYKTQSKPHLLGRTTDWRHDGQEVPRVWPTVPKN